ncbi:small metal-binding protein SmbP [Nitrosomonas sp.]|uniref:small metal-binding protein SmbP n=1 Tax=Nitrosomonas sp. TaxID=42353 RepID=UPI003306461B
MKKILSHVVFLAFFLFGSVSVQAENSHLRQAIKHTEAAMEAVDARTIAEHAEEAKHHATEAKSTDPKDQHILEGLKYLEDTIKESSVDNTDSARQAATDALNKFKQAAGKE